jgi:Protein of unknown function (DUF3800)
VNAPIRQASFARQWCTAFAHRWEPERIFVILTAYLDESGTHGQSPHTVMSGMLANALQWERFERNFRRIKAKHRFRIFHTKKFKRRDGDFKGWSNEQCLALIADLAPITATAFTEGVTFLLDNAAYDAEYKSGEAPKKLRLDSKYGLCFRNCLLFFALEALKRVHRGRYPTLNFVLESGHKNFGDALRIFNELKAELKANDCNLLGMITPADKDECDPLMMADFLAHTAFMAGSAQPTQTYGNIAKPKPIGRGQTGVTHLEFRPGGLANVKSALIDQIKARSGVAKPHASQGQSS